MEINCSQFDIPERLHKGTRIEDQNFAPQEKIYRHFPAEYLTTNPETGGKTVNPAAFRTDGMSCVREKYSDSPTDVLYDINGNHCTTCGIAQLTIENIKSINLKHPTENKNYTLNPVHKPEKCMYPHIEVFAFENEILVADVKPKSIRREIREIYSGLCEIVKFPT